MTPEHTLVRTRLLQTLPDIDQFEAALGESNPGDPLVLPTLYAAFDDATRQPEVMWGLVHVVEEAPLEAGMAALIAAIPLMQERAPEWCALLHTRLLNDQDARACYRRLLRGLPSTTSAPAQRFLQHLLENAPSPLPQLIRSALEESSEAEEPR